MYNAYVDQDQTIKNLGTSAFDKIKELLGQWIYNTGPGKTVSGEEINLLRSLICKHFSMLTLPELELAIDYCAIGRLSKDNSTFYFTPNYVGRMLNSFLQIRNTHIPELISRAKKYQRDYNKPVPAANNEPQQSMEFMKAHLMGQYNMYKLTHEISYKNHCYNYLRATKRIAPDDQQANEALEYGIKRVKADLKKVANELQPGEKKRQIRVSKDDEGVKQYARNYVVQCFFDHVDIHALLDSIHIKEFIPQS